MIRKFFDAVTEVYDRTNEFCMRYSNATQYAGGSVVVFGLAMFLWLFSERQQTASAMMIAGYLAAFVIVIFGFFLWTRADKGAERALGGALRQRER